MQFSISPDSKNQQDEKLIDKALQAFENRTQQIVKKLGHNNYKIVDINIYPPPAQGVFVHNTR